MGWKDFKPRRLVCPHCGYDGTTQPGKQNYDSPPFYWCEDVTMVWSVVAVAGTAIERGTIQMSCDSDMPGDSFNPRLFCGRCDAEFPVPNGAVADFIFDEEDADWSESPPAIRCPTCQHTAKPCSDGKTCYHCSHCGYAVGH